MRRPGRADRAAVRALRRAAAAGRRRLADPAVRADRGRRPLVRPRRRRLQGQHRHAPHRPAGARATTCRSTSSWSSRAPRSRAPAASRTSCRRTPTCCAPTRSWSATPATPPSACPAVTVSLRGMVNVVVTSRRCRPRCTPACSAGRRPDALAALVADARHAARRRRQHHDRRARQHPDLAGGGRTRPGRVPRATPGSPTACPCSATAPSRTCSGPGRRSPSSASTARRWSARRPRSCRERSARLNLRIPPGTDPDAAEARADRAPARRRAVGRAVERRDRGHRAARSGPTPTARRTTRCARR